MALRWARRYAVLAVCSAMALSGFAASAAAAPATALQAVWYAGYRFEVPASWPVIDLSRQPQTCVRFDLHAIYLGTPAANESCPGWLLGATEAIVIQPAPRGTPRQSVETAISNRITATAPGISVTATFDSDPAEITSILASAGLSAPRLAAAAPAGHTGTAHELSVEAAPMQNATSAAARSQDLPATVGNYVGLGFDTCTAPSSGAMQAWLRYSPYRAVGIYIGGADRACDQPNLTAAWVQQQVAAGWRFIPMYAGPQTALGQLTAPSQQGVADADDAVAQAQSLGFGPGTPVYYDMEAYLPFESASALQFLAAWTSQVHELGYAAGVYAGSDSGVADLAQHYQNGAATTPDVIFDALWNGEANTDDGHYLAGEWPGGLRLHQFSGNASQSFGGDSMVIDQDYLDVALPAPPAPASPAPATSPAATSPAATSPVPTPTPTSPLPTPTSAVPTPAATSAVPTPAPTSAGPTPAPASAGPTPAPASPASTPTSPAPAPTSPGTPQASPAVVTPSGTTAVFYTDSEHLIEQSVSTSGHWTRTDLGDNATGVPSVVQVGSGTIDVFYRGVGKFLWELTSNGVGWLPPQRLTQLGRVGTPEAVAQSDGVIDLFWRGFNGTHLWHARYSPGIGWAGPRNLGGFLRGSPDPVAEPSGQVQVFWRGLVDGNLWRIVGGTSATWSSPQDLGMGRLGGPPEAVALPTGEVDVFWLGLGLRHVWSTVLPPGAGPARPTVPGGPPGPGQPWPVLAAGGEWLLFQGPGRGLRTMTRAADGQWPGSLWAGISGLASAPFAATGPESGSLEVFWLSRTGQLWTASFTQAAGWSKPVELGQ
ncbi:MAG: glycoside hydrolase domain-containing protein [Streptosporangiaceae bacterium]